jgi:hypothetical protein
MDIKCLPIFFHVIYSYKRPFTILRYPLLFEEVLFTNMKVPFEYTRNFKYFNAVLDY